MSVRGAPPGPPALPGPLRYAFLICSARRHSCVRPPRNRIQPSALREPSTRSGAPSAGTPPLASAWRRLGVVVAIAVVVMSALALHAGTVEAGASAGVRNAWWPDPDSTLADSAAAAPAWPDPDSTLADSAVVDSSRAELQIGASADSTLVPPDSTRRALLYLPGVPGALGRFHATIAPEQLPGLRGRLGTYWRRTVTLDSAAYVYTVREAVGSEDVRVPSDVALPDYVTAQREAAIATGFRTLAQQRNQVGRRRQGVGFTVDIPGGQSSAFRTLFGRNEVDLTVSGRSDVDVGVRYNANALNEALTGRGGSVDPNFGQQLNLNVAGTIGDKLRINVNYDTRNQFEFENQVSLVYTGYTDDIIQRIEAGNVLLQTPSELIRGGQRLFGLRTDLQFGPLAVTAVASQQDAESTTSVFEGGAQTTSFVRAPFEYEDNTHFFLGYFFHNWWDAAHRPAGLPSAPPGVNQITGIEVWRYDPSLQTTQTDGAEIVYAIALAELGEPEDVLQGGQAYLAQYAANPGATPRPDLANGRFSAADLANLRQNHAQIDIGETYGLTQGTGFVNTRFRRLTADLDYTFDSRLGWLSLTSPLGQNDVLAVAYEYTTGPSQQAVYIGDFGQASQATTLDGPRTILKLLRGGLPTPSAPTWDLTMRNVYRVGGRGLTQDAFDLDVKYAAPSRSPTSFLPTVEFGAQQTLLQVLGLDRVNTQNEAVPDNQFDFIPGLTIDRANGRVIFPVRQPFGDYLTRLIRTGETVSGQTVSVNIAEGSVDDALASYTFEALYDQPQAVASRLPGISRYQIDGTFRSASQSVFNVGFNIVPQTITVTSNGRRLVEGADYRVNASAGTVEIINPTYLAPGQQIRIEAEQNRLFAIGAKTLLGLRADYRFSPDAGLGLTWMRLAERALDDKYAIGREALENSIVGLDGRYLATPRWITRAVDALPLIQTRAPSRFEVRGELAYLNPGHARTLAFERTRRALAASPDGIRLTDDELGGLSYIEDFDVSDNSLSLGELAGWRIAATPSGAGPAGLPPVPPGAPVTAPSRPSNWRGRFAWYTLNREVYNRYGSLVTPATQIIRAVDLYPDRGFADRSEENNPVPFLDLYFDPTDRGTYNYNGDLGGVYANNPQDVWGGMIRAVDGSYANFDGDNNVEFVEILLSATGGRDGDEPVAETARLYVDLGRLNEDVVPDGQPNTEDGILDRPPTEAELSPWGRRSGSGQQSGAVDFFRNTGRTEDLGLDGLPSSVNDVAPGGQPYALDERTHFADFLATVPDGPMRARAFRDPSEDDYRHFAEDTFYGDPTLFPGGASLQERFSRTYAGLELNSVQAYAAIAQTGREGISNRPDTEDVNGDGQYNAADVQYHRYELPLDAAGLASHPFVQGTINARGQTFYLVRIPVRTSLRTTVGYGPDNQDDFSLIEMMRLWTTGHDREATLRIASLRLVGSQWLKSARVGTDADPSADVTTGLPPDLFIESINNEDSPDRYAIPRTAVRKEVRSASGAAVPAREASIVFRAEGLDVGRSAGITRTYTRPFDLTRYTNVRMFVHGNAFQASDSVRVFLRLGDDETQNYYEIEQPIYPFDPAATVGMNEAARADSLWQTNVRRPDGTTYDRNSINVVLAELNRLKVARDDARADPSQPFEGPSTPEGAPPGARIRIVGQPSIGSVRSIVLGVRNGRGGAERMLDTVQVWFNELRVSGYDERGGASGFVTANLVLADVANLSARATMTQDGFGELGGGLGSRTFADRSGLSLTGNFNAHKLLPERFGWNIPVAYTYNQSGQTPRFDPERGDIRLSDQREAILRDTSAAAPPEAERRARADALIARAQTITSTRTFRVQASKTGSRSPWLRYSVDGLTASFASTASAGRNPTLQASEQDQWTANMAYRLNVPRARTVRPLWFTEGVPLLGAAVGGVRLNWLPQSLTFTTGLNRSINTQQPRARLAFAADPDSVVAFRTRRQTTHAFTHGRTLDVQYAPLTFLRLAFGSDTDQDFGAAGQRQRNRVLVYRPATDSTDAFIRSYALSIDDARLDPQVRADLRAVYGDLIPESGSLPGFVQLLGGPILDPLPVGQAFSNIFGGDGVRTRAYTQNAQGTLTVSTRRIRRLGWLRPQPVSYQATYGWTDITPPQVSEDLRVAAAQTQARLQTGIQLSPRELWRQFPFYRRLEASALRTPGAGAAPGTAPARPTGLTPAGRPSGGVTPATPPAADTTGRQGFNPFAGIERVPRTLFLGITGATDLTATYRGTYGSGASGLTGGAYSLFSGLTGRAPGLPFRLGFARRIPIGGRLDNDSLRLNLEDRLTDNHVLEARTTIEPLPMMRVGLVAQTNFTRDATTPYTYPDEGSGLTAGLPIVRGNGTSSVFGLGGSYERFLERHADRIQRDVNAADPGAGPVPSEALTRAGLAEDFGAVFARGLGRFGPRGLFTLPVPGWDVTYTGLGRLPLLRRATQQVTLRHNYTAQAQSAYSSFTTPPVPRTVGTGADQVTLVAPPADGPSEEATSYTASQSFQPLIGVQISWRGNFQTSLSFERSSQYLLQTTAAQLTEKEIENLRLEVSWSRQGLRLPGLRRLRNSVTFNLAGSASDDVTYNRSLGADVAATYLGTPLNVVEPNRLRRYQLSPRLGYTVSNQVTASLFVTYSRTVPENRTSLPTTDFDGGVSLRILFSN